MTTTLVTGAGGFIGSHLVEALLERGDEVRALVRYNSQASWGHLNHLASACPKGLDVRHGDVTDGPQMERLVRGCTLVFHLAALIGIPYSYDAPASYLHTNAYGTLNILHACQSAGVDRLVLTSTSEVYGSAVRTPMDESHPLQAQSPYAASKIAADKLAESFHRAFGLRLVVIRPFNTYGPRQSLRALIPTVLVQALAGTETIQVGNLYPRRDLTFVGDTVRAFVLAADAPRIEGETIHLGTGIAHSVEDIARQCLEVVGSKAVIVSTETRKRPERSEVDVLLSDPSRAERLLSWRAEVSLTEGLARTAAFLETRLDSVQAQRYVQ